MTGARAGVLASALVAALASCPVRTRAEDGGFLGRTNPLADLVPSPTARAERERERVHAELGRVLRLLPGVEQADVSLRFPSADSAALDQPLPVPHATLALRVRGAGPSEAEVARLAHHILPPGTRLLVQRAPAPVAALPETARKAAPAVRVGPFWIAPQSAGTVRAAFAALLVSNALLALLLLRRRLR